MKIEDLQPLVLIQNRRGEVLKVSTIYGPNQVSATVLLESDGTPPPRTTVRFYDAAEVEKTWRFGSAQAARKVDDVYAPGRFWR